MRLPAARLHRVFAFGTMKAGFALHELGLAGIPRLAFVRTVRRFPMFVAGPWFAPMMLDEPGMGHHVRGELYEVDDGRLATIDGLESVGKPGNFRVVLGVETLDGARSWQAFAYMKGKQLATPLHTGYLETYEDRRFVPFDRRGYGG